ncbi:hypothetical protein GDO81_006823 [Engystomops pustulosus]|uniref:Uncharacterized protein n=1 Tax=Engystomops pustulosus TaxID=76066 RepID=A0AAV7D2Y3_ENGPU|nr:hypothetical protein GDO81_006823 [Engystomops pustulosus]
MTILFYFRPGLSNHTSLIFSDSMPLPIPSCSSAYNNKSILPSHSCNLGAPLLFHLNKITFLANNKPFITYIRGAYHSHF